MPAWFWHDMTPSGRWSPKKQYDFPPRDLKPSDGALPRTRVVNLDPALEGLPLARLSEIYPPEPGHSAEGHSDA